jgi:hypothetical protein
MIHLALTALEVERGRATLASFLTCKFTQVESFLF